MNIPLVILSCALCLVQISAQQYFQQLGTNYNTGDQSRQEIVDANGNIKGQYSYIDPNGETVLVRYTAGKNGFQVENNPQPLRPQSAPIAPSTYIQPGINYRGLQLSQPKYRGQQLFRPSPNSIPAATPKQIEAYREALREELNTNQISQFDVTPAQFPQQNPPLTNNILRFEQPAPLKPTSYQRVSFSPAQQNAGVQSVTPQLNYVLPNIYQPNSQEISQPTTQYQTDAQLFQPNLPELRQIAQNPIPPEFKILSQQGPRRIATPITEESDENTQQLTSNGFDYLNFNF